MQSRSRQARRVRLSQGGRLETEGRLGFHLLRYPAGVVRLNESAAAVLRLCDGTRNPGEIVTQLFPGRCGGDALRLVSEFLDAAQRRKWIIESDSQGEEERKPVSAGAGNISRADSGF